VQELDYFFSTYMVGKADIDGITEEDVDPDELKMGMDVELEHTQFAIVARKIALDHLAEIPDYYTRLKEMEEEAEEEYG